MLRKKKTIGFQDLNFTAEIIGAEICSGAVCWSGSQCLLAVLAPGRVVCIILTSWHAQHLWRETKYWQITKNWKWVEQSTQITTHNLPHIPALGWEAVFEILNWNDTFILIYRWPDFIWKVWPKVCHNFIIKTATMPSFPIMSYLGPWTLEW